MRLGYQVGTTLVTTARTNRDEAALPVFSHFKPRGQDESPCWHCHCHRSASHTPPSSKEQGWPGDCTAAWEHGYNFQNSPQCVAGHMCVCAMERPKLFQKKYFSLSEQEISMFTKK